MATSNLRFPIIGEDRASDDFLRVAAAAKLTKSTFDDLNSSALGLTKLMGGASLVPVLAGTTAAVAELGTALGAAGLASAAFGLSAGGIFKDMLKSRQDIVTTQNSLAKLTKGTTEYQTKLALLHKQQQSFNREFGPAAKGYDDMTASFIRFKASTSGVTKGVLHDAFEGVAAVLPKLVPVSNAAGKAVGGLLDELVGWTKSSGFDDFLHFLETSGPRDITAFGHIFANTIGGIAGILENFVGPGDHAAKTLEHLTARFDEWGHSRGVSDSVDRFLRYVSDNGPEITAAMEALAESSPKIATALGHLGSANLSVTSRFLNLVAGLPQGAFNAIADSLFAIAAGSKLVAGAKGIAALVALGRTGLGAGGKSTGGGSLLGGAGVQKVYVVNMGPGGMGGGSKLPGGGAPVVAGGAGLLSTLLGGAAGLTALVAIQAGARKVLQQEYGKVVGGIFSNVESAIVGLPPPSTIGTQWDHIWKPVFDNIGSAVKHLGVPHVSDLLDMGGGSNKPSGIRSTTTAVDSLRNSLAKASQGMELVGHSAQRAVGGTATKAVQNAAAKLQALNGAHASAQMDLVGHSAQRAGNVAGVSIDSLTGKINHIPNKNVHIGADTGQAQSRIQALINSISRIHDKTVHITSYTNATIAEHVTGPPKKKGSGSGSGASAGPGGSGGGGGGPFAGLRALFPNVRRGSAIPIQLALGRARTAAQAARGRLAADRGTRNQFAGGFQSFASSLFGASYGQDAQGNEVAPTIDSILAYQAKQADQAKEVNRDVHSLVKKGLSPALLKQLQSQGAAGMAEIQALASATPEQIARLNALQKQTSSNLRSAGMAAGNSIYGKQLAEDRQRARKSEHLLNEIRDELRKNKHLVIEDVNGQWVLKVIHKEKRTKRQAQTGGGK